MYEFLLAETEVETYEADGHAKTKSPDGNQVIKIWLHIRRDREIPEFDSIENLKFWTNGFTELQDYHFKLIQMLTEFGGMFIEDALKLRDKDIISMVDHNFHPKDEFPIPLLKALKKAILNYFENTGQEQRKIRASTTLVCKCRHVTDLEIEDAVKRGYDTFEKVQMFTGAGTGCNSCVNKTMELVQQYRKTSLGEIK